MTVDNAGEYSDLTFTFKTDTGYTVGEYIEITFPHVFDPFIGKASQWFAQESGSYYLHCESSSMSLSWCTVDKWKVSVWGSAAVDAASNIDITLKYVALPNNVGTTTDKIMLAVRDATHAVKSLTADFAGAGVTIAAVPTNNINIASVMASNHKLFANTVTYSFQFYLA